MGGNASFINRSTGEVLGYAEKFPLIEVGRIEFRNKIVQFCKKLNELFFRFNKVYLWENEKLIENGYIFNGSTEHLFNDEISNSEFYKLKPLIGDVDVTVPRELLEKLYNLLALIEGHEILSNISYLGQVHREFVHEKQINSVFLFVFEERNFNVQVDFEGSRYVRGMPDEYSKWSHSSPWSDIQKGLKGLAHKLLVKNIVRAISTRNDILVITPKSSSEEEKLRFKKDNSEKPVRTHVFSVDGGLRQAIFPVMQGKEILKKDSRKIYREMWYNEDTSIRDVELIFQFIFKHVPSYEEKIKFSNFFGTLDLLKSNFNINIVYLLFSYLLEKDLFGKDAQSIEREDLHEDRNIKLKIITYFISYFPELNKFKEIIKDKVAEYYINLKHEKEQDKD